MTDEEPETGALRSSLIWQPIDQYDRAADAVALLRADDEQAVGFWGDTTLREYERGERWRDAQESMDEAPLRFEPVEFAELSDEMRARLMAD